MSAIGFASGDMKQGTRENQIQVFIVLNVYRAKIRDKA